MLPCVCFHLCVLNISETIKITTGHIYITSSFLNVLIHLERKQVVIKQSLCLFALTAIKIFVLKIAAHLQAEESPWDEASSVEEQNRAQGPQQEQDTVCSTPGTVAQIPLTAAQSRSHRVQCL